MKIVPGAAGFAAIAAARSTGAAPRRSRSPSATSTASTSDTQRCSPRRARAPRATAAPSAVLTFTPHPARLFAPDRAPPLIMSLERRLELLAEAGIDIAIVEPFTRAFAAIEARRLRARRAGARPWRARRGRRLRLQLRPRARRDDARVLRELGAAARHRRRRDPARSPSTACPARRRAIRELVAGGRHGGGRPAARPAVRDRGRGGARRGRGAAASAFRPPTSSRRPSCCPKLGSTRRAR